MFRDQIILQFSEDYILGTERRDIAQRPGCRKGSFAAYRISSCKCADEFSLFTEFDLCKLFPQYELQIELEYYILRNVLAKDFSIYKKKMAFLETGEISYSPVVKVNVCNTILLIKGWRMNAILYYLSFLW
jgi:hypothetical protein